MHVHRCITVNTGLGSQDMHCGHVSVADCAVTATPSFPRYARGILLIYPATTIHASASHLTSY